MCIRDSWYVFRKNTESTDRQKDALTILLASVGVTAFIIGIQEQSQVLLNGFLIESDAFLYQALIHSLNIK